MSTQATDDSVEADPCR